MKSSSPVIFQFGQTLACLAVTILLSTPQPSALAAPVDSKQAAAMVAGWLRLDRVPLGAHLGTTVQRVDTFKDSAGSPAYYVVYLDPAGFVIVAGDDLVEPIIGFASAGTFDPSDANPLGALVTRDVPARVAHARKLGANSSGAKSEPKPSGGALAAWKAGHRPTDRRRKELSAYRT